jgi:hypothetical protein
MVDPSRTPRQRLVSAAMPLPASLQVEQSQGKLRRERLSPSEFAFGMEWASTVPPDFKPREVFAPIGSPVYTNFHAPSASRNVAVAQF